MDIRKLSYYLKTSTESKFPKSSATAVGGLYFLRFVCPTLINPVSLYGGGTEYTAGIPNDDEGGNTAGSGPGELSREERRPLLLISKALQNLSNNLHFNEEYMQFLNDWIDTKQKEMIEFLESMAVTQLTSKPQNDNNTPQSQPLLTEEEGHTLYDVFERNSQTLVTQLQNSNTPSPMIDDLNSVLYQLGEIEEKSGKKKKKKK